jgi:ABC-type multidrug transport system ATPase subunit
MFGFVTPREAMAFSARLRLPASTSKETITTMVNRMVRRLGLEGYAHLDHLTDTTLGS